LLFLAVTAVGVIATPGLGVQVTASPEAVSGPSDEDSTGALAVSLGLIVVRLGRRRR